MKPAPFATEAAEGVLVGRLRTVSHAASALALGLGLLVLVGWAAHLSVLTSVGPGLSTMKPNTAISFALCGASLWLRLTMTSRVGRAVATTLAAIVLIIGIGTLFEYAAGRSIGIDQWLVVDDVSTSGVPGRMGSNTAMCFVLVAVAILLGNSWPLMTQLLALTNSSVAMIVLIGYAYSVEPLYGIASYTQMAIHTAAGLAVLGVGIAAVHPRSGLMGVVTSSGPGGLFTRTMLPAVILGPPLLGWFRLLGQRAGWYGTEFGLALFATSNALVLAGVMWLFAIRLDRSRNQAQQYLDTAAVILLALDVQGRITLVNRYACSILGRTADELIGRDWAETCLPVRVRDEFRQKFHNLIGGDFSVVENPILTKSGEERLIEWRNTLLRDDGGQVIGTLSSGADITERNQAVEALRTTEERMRFALQSADIGVWDMDYTNGVIQWSETMEAHHGLQPGTFGGTFEAFVERIHPDDRESVLETVGKAMKLGADFSIQNRARWPDGTIRWLTGAGRVHLGEHGAPVRGIGISLDVTERHTLEQQYRQAQKMEAIGRLAGGVAHDFNNLLTAILGYAGMLAEEFAVGDPKRADIEEIRKAGERAAGLTRQLLAFSRQQVMQSTILDLNGLTNNLANMLRRLIGEHIELNLTLSSDLGSVRADPGQLEQVIMNLAVNARDAMALGGRLTVETANIELDDAYGKSHGIAPFSAGSFVMLAVSDTGIGMDEVTRRRIFEPFFTTKPRDRGTGLGLATVYGIVKQSGGYVWAYSEPGQGTTFKIYLPRIDEPAAALSEAGVSKEVIDRGSETILLVEDEESVRVLSRTLLERSGYRVLEAANPQEALATISGYAEPIDLLLTDIMMPGESGPELFRHLRVVRPATRVLYISGYADQAIISREVLEAGVPFLQKPFSAAALARKVREVLDSDRGHTESA